MGARGSTPRIARGFPLRPNPMVRSGGSRERASFQLALDRSLRHPLQMLHDQLSRPDPPILVYV
jgi:hypothetical protein